MEAIILANKLSIDSNYIKMEIKWKYILQC